MNKPEVVFKLGSGILSKIQTPPKQQQKKFIGNCDICNETFSSRITRHRHYKEHEKTNHEKILNADNSTNSSELKQATNEKVPKRRRRIRLKADVDKIGGFVPEVIYNRFSKEEFSK